jgi:hypothetical protein
MFIELTVLFFCLSHFISILCSRTSLGSMQPVYSPFLFQPLLLFRFNIVSTSNQSQDSSVGIAMGWIFRVISSRFAEYSD